MGRGALSGAGFNGKDGGFAGEKVWLSTEVSTVGEKVQNDETWRPHRRGFLLKLGKVVSGRGGKRRCRLSMRVWGGGWWGAGRAALMEEAESGGTSGGAERSWSRESAVGGRGGL